jgi:ABC-type iron transport system FetAB ATPase subunit
VLHDFCQAILDARDAGALKTDQEQRYAQYSEFLIRAFAKIDIIALVDEATGYQEERERNELHKLLAKYLAEERLMWAKMFPDEFYSQIYRLKRWPYPAGTNRTPFIGKITNQIVYEKLPPGVLVY